MSDRPDPDDRLTPEVLGDPVPPTGPEPDELDPDDWDDDLDDDDDVDEDNPLAALLGGGGGGGIDMGSLLDSAMQMQQQLMAAREDAAAQVVEGAAGGGVVRVEVTGGMEFRKVTIDPDAVDPDDLTLLEDLVLAALHDAVARANALQSEAMGGLGIPGTDMGLPGTETL